MEMEKSMSDGLATVPGYYSSLVKSAGTRVFFVFRGGKEKKKKLMAYGKGRSNSGIFVPLLSPFLATESDRAKCADDDSWKCRETREREPILSRLIKEM